MSKNDGGPAFPTEAVSLSTGAGTPLTGMSLHDWFAGQALAGMSGAFMDPEKAKILLRHGSASGRSVGEVIASSAYALSDAMLAQRDRQP